MLTPTTTTGLYIEHPLRGVTMRSQLTRHVFRQIIYNELHSSTQPWFPATRYCLRARRCPALPTTSRRTLFGFGIKEKRQPKPIDYEPGFATMMDLSHKLSARVRAPPSEELARAFVDFFRSKWRAGLSLEDIQLQYSLETFRHLKETYTEVPNFGLESKELRMALKILKTMSRFYQSTQHKARNDIARSLFEELKRRR